MSTNENTKTDREEGLALITDACAPFDHADADVILRSCDNVDFKVFKSFLSFSSPFFKDMFTLPQLPEGNNSSEIKDGLPVITVTEESKTLERLLLLCYPTNTPVLDVLGDVRTLLDAGIKYSINRVEKWARECLMLPKFVDSVPIRVFAIAYRYRLQEEAKTAFMATFGSPPVLEQAIEKDLDHITGTQLYRIMQYQQHCASAASKLTADFSWIKRRFCWFQCPQCRMGWIETGSDIYETETSLSRWWDAHMKRVAAALADGTWGKKMHETLTEEAAREAAKCKGTCQQGASVEILEFSACLEAEIQRVVAKVSHSFPRFKRLRLISIRAGPI